MKHLPPRQLETLRLCAMGYLDKEIAHFMHCSVATVKAQLRMLRRELNCNNRVKLALTYHDIEWRTKCENL